jgi:hypothetical protein
MNWYDVNFYSKINGSWMTLEIHSNAQAGAKQQIKALFPDASSITFKQKQQSDAEKAAGKKKKESLEAAKARVLEMVLAFEANRRI